jgi:hypothetical protein
MHPRYGGTIAASKRAREAAIHTELPGRLYDGKETGTKCARVFPQSRQLDSEAAAPAQL